MPKEELTLTFGSKTGDRFEFTLASIDEYGFVAGAIRLTAGGRSVVLDDRNGIEAMALTHLRRDVQQLLQQDGNLDFGDHDYARMVEVERRGGVVRHTLTCRPKTSGRSHSATCRMTTFGASSKS